MKDELCKCCELCLVYQYNFCKRNVSGFIIAPKERAFLTGRHHWIPHHPFVPPCNILASCWVSVLEELSPRSSSPWIYSERQRLLQKPMRSTCPDNDSVMFQLGKMLLKISLSLFFKSLKLEIRMNWSRINSKMTYPGWGPKLIQTCPHSFDKAKIPHLPQNYWRLHKNY